jgi:uncharacterized membrane protein HdeD (DUF308 family)
VSAARGTADQRVAAALSGLASVVFGVLALSWPDVTVLVIAVVFGARTVLFGISQIALVFSHREPGTGSAAGKPQSRSRLHRWSRVAGSALALALLAVSVAVHKSAPSPDAFYTAPATVPSQPDLYGQARGPTNVR